MNNPSPRHHDPLDSPGPVGDHSLQANPTGLNLSDRPTVGTDAESRVVDFRVRRNNREARLALERGASRLAAPARGDISPTAIQLRVDRLQRECDMAMGPALLLAVASVILALVLGWSAMLDKAAPAHPAVPSEQHKPTH